MSLRIFHIVFVVVTVILSFWIALWGIQRFAQEQDTMGLVVGLLFLATAIVLMIYGRKVFGKLKELS